MYACMYYGVDFMPLYVILILIITFLKLIVLN